MCNAIDINEAEITLAPTMVPTEKPTSLSYVGEACTSNSQCAIGLVCHQESNTCTCNVETNEGCSTGNICAVYSESEIPKCSCNMDVDDGNNGCDPGQVSRRFRIHFPLAIISIDRTSLSLCSGVSILMCFPH